MEKTPKKATMHEVRSKLINVTVIGIVALALASCATPKAETPTPMEVLDPEPMGIICSAPTISKTAMRVILISPSTEKNAYLVDSQLYAGSQTTKQDPNGHITPYEGMVRTGLKLLLPINSKKDSNGNTTLVMQDIEYCITPPEDLAKLKKILKGAEFKPKNIISYNGRPTKFDRSTVNPRGFNEFKGRSAF